MKSRCRHLREGPLGLAAVLALGCASPPRRPASAEGGSAPLAAPQSSSPSRPVGAAEGDSELPPLRAERPFLTLPVAGHRPAIVSVPVGARSARPVIVAAHGAGGRPEWQCELWRRVVGDRAFVLCVTGKAMYPYEPPDYAGYYFTGHPALGREMEAAFQALQERFVPYVDGEAPVFAGYSQGAIMGALLLPDHPLRFGRAVLIEGGFGGFQEWNIAVARRFAERAGRRVLLACGRLRCVEQARQTARYLRRGGLAARVVYARGAGHSYGWPMERELRDAFAWLVADDVRF